MSKIFFCSLAIIMMALLQNVTLAAELNDQSIELVTPTVEPVIPIADSDIPTDDPIILETDLNSPTDIPATPTTSPVNPVENSNILTLKGINVGGGFIIGAKYDGVQLQNAKIGKAMIFESKDQKISVINSSDASINELVFTRPGLIENEGYIYALDARASTEISGQGKIDFTIRDGRIENQTGFVNLFGNVYYANSDGSIAKGIIEIDGSRYYFDNNGIRKTGIVSIDGNKYFFNESGSMALDTWADNRYRAGKNGILVDSITGNTDLDSIANRVLTNITTGEMTDRQKMYAIYKWLPKNIGWRGTFVNFTASQANNFKPFVFSKNEVISMALSAYSQRKGPCEHYAALGSVLIQRLGYQTREIYGLRKGYSYAGAPWGEHAWVEITIDGAKYHFDPQYAANHMSNNRDYYFLLPEKESKAHHRW